MYQKCSQISESFTEISKSFYKAQMLKNSSKKKPCKSLVILKKFLKVSKRFTKVAKKLKKLEKPLHKISRIC